MPEDLRARAEERVVVGEEDGDGRSYRADVAVIEPWRAGFPSLGTSEDKGGGTLAVAEPLLFIEHRVTERWIEIHDAGGELITVIEVLSPGNKTDAGARSYRQRQQHFIAAGVNLVEIDLVRGGTHVVSIARQRLSFPPGTCHLVCVSRAIGEEYSRWEVYLCPLRNPLPVVRVPLRPNDPDAPLALQPLIDRCYRTGRYWLSRPTLGALQPVAEGDAEAVWIEERLRS